MGKINYLFTPYRGVDEKKAKNDANFVTLN